MKSKNMSQNVFLWALYDFANTPLIVALTGLYFAQWVVLDNHFDDIWYGGTFALATILLLISSPFWGAWSDKIGKRMPFITWATMSLVFFGVLMALVTTSSLSTGPKVIIALVFFLILQYGYQISLIFYNTLLNKLSTRATRGRISGIGRVFGEAGWLLGPVILLPFATGQITLFGTPGRAQVFLPAVLLLGLLGLPMIFWFKEPKTPLLRGKVDLKGIYEKTIQSFKDLIRKEKNVTIFLVAFMLISDALLTATLYFAIFLDQIYKISDSQKVIVLVFMAIVAVLGAYIFGWLGDKYGLKKLLLFACFNLTIAFPLIILSSSLSFLYVLTFFLGLGYSGFYVTARALLVKISPALQLGEYFGFYATFERFASIIGPLTWGAITLALKDYGVIKYRVAALSLVVLMVVGTLLLTRVREARQTQPLNGRKNTHAGLKGRMKLITYD